MLRFLWVEHVFNPIEDFEMNVHLFEKLTRGGVEYFGLFLVKHLKTSRRNEAVTK